MERKIISVSGSLLGPERRGWMKRFAKLLEGQKCVLVCGGGDLARRYQAVRAGDEDRDWLGIYATWLNARLLKCFFKDAEFLQGIKRPKKPIAIAGGWKPGFSTDYVAVRYAKLLGSRKLINLTHIDYLYTKDPSLPEAEPILRIGWQEYLKRFWKPWKPGLRMPFDPVASKLAAKLRLKVILVNGERLSEVRKALQGKSFKGSVIG